MESSWRISSCLNFIIIFLLFFSAAIYCAVSAPTTPLLSSSSSSSDTRCSSTDQKPLSDDLDEEISKLKNKAKASSSSSSSASYMKDIRRRLRGGPGSSPPRCYGKCGKCTPCRPVHVAVPPGTPVTAEYYPEAWRCKCGNKLYMP